MRFKTGNIFPQLAHLDDVWFGIEVFVSVVIIVEYLAKTYPKT